MLKFATAKHSMFLFHIVCAVGTDVVARFDELATFLKK